MHAVPTLHVVGQAVPEKDWPRIEIVINPATGEVFDGLYNIKGAYANILWARLEHTQDKLIRIAESAPDPIRPKR